MIAGVSGGAAALQERAFARQILGCRHWAGMRRKVPEERCRLFPRARERPRAPNYSQVRGGNEQSGFRTDTARLAVTWEGGCRGEARALRVWDKESSAALVQSWFGDQAVAWCSHQQGSTRKRLCCAASEVVLRNPGCHNLKEV